LPHHAYNVTGVTKGAAPLDCSFGTDRHFNEARRIYERVRGLK
jgi:hypothetical protein